jgi:hypothetical protein
MPYGYDEDDDGILDTLTGFRLLMLAGAAVSICARGAEVLASVQGEIAARGITGNVVQAI